MELLKYNLKPVRRAGRFVGLPALQVLPFLGWFLHAAVVVFDI
jgi:hypothetical protein